MPKKAQPPLGGKRQAGGGPSVVTRKPLSLDEQQYRLLFEHMLSGFALHEIICDRDGVPQDYRFLLVNQAFEDLTGLKGAEIVGRTVREVLPEVEPFWIERYGKVALGGEAIRFEEYSAGLGRYFEVLAYCPEAGKFAVIFNDVSDRKAQEQELRESREDLSHAQAVAETGSWRLDVRNNELRWSNETYRLFGIPAGTLLSYENFLAAVHPEDRETVERAWQAALQGEPYDIEHRILVDGEVRWVRERAELEFDQDGTLLGGFGTVQDITARKSTEEALRHSEQHFRSLFDNSLDAIFALGPEGNFIAANGAAQELAGYSLEEFRELHFWDICAPDRQAEATRAFREAFCRQSRSLETAVITKGGERLELFITGAPVVLDARVVGVSCIARDVTERKIIEEKLRESEKRYRGTFDNAAVGIAHIGLDGRLLSVNRRLGEILGYPRDELLGKALRDIVLDEDLVEVKTQVARLIGGKIDACRVEQRFQRKNRSTAWVHLTLAVQKNERNEPLHLIAIVMDISDRKRMENELLQARDAAEEASRIKGRFLANMSHEIRTPMSGVMGMLDLVLDTPLNPEQKRCLGMAREAADSLLQVINDILDFSRIEENKLVFRQNPFGLRECIGSAIDLLAPKVSEKGLRLELDITAGVPGIVVGDSDRLRQVLFNLVGNAIKFTESGKISVSVEPCPEGTAADGHYLLFSVRDTGIGIPANQLSRLFEAFSQADESFTRSYGGAGLGLAISKEIVARFGGDIRVESEVGRGSSFFFTARFGRAEAALAAAPGEPETAETVAGSASPCRILLVEDDRVIRDVMLLVLGKRGWQITVATSGEEGVTRWRQESFDLILMDIQMPGMDGFEATRIIRSEEAAEAHIPIIALTAHAMRESRERCLNSGMDDFLSKPIQVQELYRKVEQRLGLDTPSGDRA